jgi:hypothetical protein
MRTKLWLATLVAAGCAAGEGTPGEYPTMVVDGRPVVLGVRPNAVKVDYMLRGYFYAGSPKSEGLGGNGTSSNMPKPIGELKSVLTATDGLHVLALVDEERTFAKTYEGFRVVVANASNKPIEFSAQDARLYIVHEAQDETGAWRPIEYLPSSWCGNSYHTLTLPPRTYWDFTAPHYEGDFTTRVRIRVALNDGENTRYTYSDEFASRINRKQFIEKQGHTATNIMDPYSD